MAQKDEDERALELPSFGFGRKRKKSDPAPEPAPEPAPAAREPIEETATRPTSAPEPTPDPEPEPAPEPELVEQTVTQPVVEAPAPPPPPPPTPTPAPAPAAPEPAAAPLFVDEVEPEPETTEEPAPADGERKADKEPREIRLPAVSGMTAAIVTGALVGLLAVGLTWGVMRGCEALQGTSSCGDPGYLLLVAILVAAVVLGAVLLRAWGVPDPGSTSFLGVGLLAVIALLFLVDVLFDWWMVIAIPVVSVLTFVLSHWVTTAIVEPAKD